MLANGGWDLTLILLTWTIWWAPTNASKWRMGFNSAFKGLQFMTCSGSDRLVSGLEHNYLEVFRGFTYLLGSEIKFQGRIITS